MSQQTVEPPMDALHGQAALRSQIGETRFNADWKNPQHRMRRLLAEFIGTAGLTFVLSAGAAILALYAGRPLHPFEAAFILSGYKGVEVWLLPIPMHKFTMVRFGCIAVRIEKRIRLYTKEAMTLWMVTMLFRRKIWLTGPIMERFSIRAMWLGLMADIYGHQVRLAKTENIICTILLETKKKHGKLELPLAIHLPAHLKIQANP